MKLIYLVTSSPHPLLNSTTFHLSDAHQREQVLLLHPGSAHQEEGHLCSSSPPSSESTSQALQCYFVAASSELVQGSTETDEPFITADSIKSISKLSLVPRQKTPEISSKGPDQTQWSISKIYVFISFFLVIGILPLLGN